MTLIDYLLKHGCSAFIDEFNDQQKLLTSYIDYSHSKDKQKNEIIIRKSKHLLNLLINK